MDQRIPQSRRELLAQRPTGVLEDVHFTESLASAIIETYSRPGDTVLDPFAGFGTAAIVAARLGRHPIAIELLADRAATIRERLDGRGVVITGDARALSSLVHEPVNLCLTSPPYMARRDHLENPLTAYQTLDGDYRMYLEELDGVVQAIATLLRPGGHLALNVAVISNDETRTDLPTDIGRRAKRHLDLIEDIEIVWDELAPGVVDDRCLVFQKAERRAST